MLKLSLMKSHAVLLAILIGAFSLVLTNSAFNLLLPYFVQYYQISTTAGGWIIALYMLAMTLTMPLASLIVDRLGRKQTYMLGITIYGLFSVAGALFYHSIEVLLLVRFMHGVAAGLMIPLSLVLLFDVYGPEVRGELQERGACCLCWLRLPDQRWAASSYSMDGLKCCSGSMCH